MSADDICEPTDENGLTQSERESVAAGWVVSTRSDGRTEIQKCDLSTRFESDDDALAHVQLLATLGDTEAIAALDEVDQLNGK